MLYKITVQYIYDNQIVYDMNKETSRLASLAMLRSMGIIINDIGNLFVTQARDHVKIKKASDDMYRLKWSEISDESDYNTLHYLELELWSLFLVGKRFTNKGFYNIIVKKVAE